MSYKTIFWKPDNRVEALRTATEKYIIQHPNWTPSFEEVLRLEKKYKVSGKVILDVFDETKEELEERSYESNIFRTRRGLHRLRGDAETH